MILINILMKFELTHNILRKIRLFKEHMRDKFLQQTPEMNSLKGRFTGERCFIVVTGPSLTLSDLNMLKGEYCFSVNSILNSFENTDWRPDFYVVSDPIPFRKMENKIIYYQKQIKFIFLPKFFKAKNINHISFVSSYTQYTEARHKNDFSIVKPYDTENYFIDATTVTFTCIQIARFLGFSKVYLLGQDCDFSGKNQHSIIADPGYSHRIGEDVAIKHIQIFDNYKKFYKDKNFEIFNCTRGGKLEVFPRVELEDVVKVAKF